MKRAEFLPILPDTSYRIRLQRILGPGMLGIAAAEFLPYLKVGSFPETAEVGGELYGFESRGEQFHQDRTTAFIHAGRILEAEALLQADTEDGRIGPLPVFDPDPAAGGDGDMGGSIPFDSLSL